MKPERPFLDTLKWIAVGVLIGMLIMLGLSHVNQSPTQNDEALDEQARRSNQ